MLFTMIEQSLLGMCRLSNLSWACADKNIYTFRVYGYFFLIFIDIVLTNVLICCICHLQHLIGEPQCSLIKIVYTRYGEASAPAMLTGLLQIPFPSITFFLSR